MKVLFQRDPKALGLVFAKPDSKVVEFGVVDLEDVISPRGELLTSKKETFLAPVEDFSFDLDPNGSGCVFPLKQVLEASPWFINLPDVDIKNDALFLIAATQRDMQDESKAQHLESLLVSQGIFRRISR